MIECLKEMLTSDEQWPTYIILDAIDECPLRSSVGPPRPRDDVLDFINELVGFCLPNVHICATSRPEVDIQAILGPLTLHPISLHNQSGQKQDIADYVRSFVETDRRMRRWRDEDKKLVIKILPEKADGMYVYLHMALINSYRMTQVSVGILPIGSSTGLFPIECAAYHGGVTWELGRDLRADTAGDQKAERGSRSSNVTMSGGSCSPSSSCRTGGGPCA
jgi:hypothetical protein